MNYEEWLREWLESYVKPSSKQKTYIRYSEIVAGHIVPKFGNCNMNELSPLILQRYTNELLQNGNMKTGRGLSANSVNGIITVIQNSLKAAFTLGFVSEFSANKIKRPKAVERQVTCFTKQEQTIIEQAVLSEKKPKMYGIILCLYTGLRIGELLALTWNDIDLFNGTISVCKTCYDGKDRGGTYGRIIEAPKTNASVRVVPIPNQLLPFMNSWKNVSRFSYIVSNGERGISLRGYQRMFERLLNRIGIPHKGFHALRHTFATRALECGMDVKTLSEILGHKNANITLNRYVHSLTEHKQAMMNLVGRLIFVSQNATAPASV